MKREKVKLEVPEGNELPGKGFLKGEAGYIKPAEDGKIKVIINMKAKDCKN